MGDAPAHASSTLLEIVRRREAHRVSNVLEPSARLPATFAGNNPDDVDDDNDDNEDDEDDEDDKRKDNKGKSSAVPSWQLVASSWSEKADKKEQDSEETEEEAGNVKKGDVEDDTDTEEVLELPNEEEEEEESVSQASDADFVPPIADDDKGQKAATASAPHLIPTTKKQRKSSVVNLHTNRLDPPKFDLLHEAQQPVSADAPGFREALDVFVVPPQLMSLHQNCLAKPKDSFFISASVHIHVISHACGLTTKDMLKMRGWVFLKKKSLGGSPCRRQSCTMLVGRTLDTARKRGR
jgi:hypothetical protein